MHIDSGTPTTSPRWRGGDATRVAMDDLQSVLAHVGFGGQPREPEFWQVRRIGMPIATTRRRREEPARSAVLLCWLERLRDRRRPSPYQICPAMRIAAAKDQLGRHTR